MTSDVPSEPPASAFEDFLAGKPGESLAPREAGVVAPPAAEDGPRLARIVANIRAELTRQTRSEATAVLPEDMTVRAYGNVGEFSYRPDVIVDAGLPPPGELSARNPQVIFEVAAAGSARAGFIAQWQIHHALPTLGIYVLVDAVRPEVTIYRRIGEEWKAETLEEIDDQFILPTIHGLLSLKTIYAGIFPEEEAES